MIEAAAFLTEGARLHQSGVYRVWPSAPAPRICPEVDMGTPAAARSLARFAPPMSWAVPKMNPPGMLVGGWNGWVAPIHTGGTMGLEPGTITQSGPQA